MFVNWMQFKFFFFLILLKKKKCTWNTLSKWITFLEFMQCWAKSKQFYRFVTRQKYKALLSSNCFIFSMLVCWTNMIFFFFFLLQFKDTILSEIRQEITDNLNKLSAVRFKLYFLFITRHMQFVMQGSYSPLSI